MKKIKLLVTTMIVFICISTILAPNCFAVDNFTNIKRHVDINSASVDDDRFKHEWEHTRKLYVDGDYKAKLVYGYDTNFTKEDYAWCVSEEYKSRAGIKRDNDKSGGAFDTEYKYSSYAAKTKYAKYETKHTRDNVYYICEIHFKYTGDCTYTSSYNTTEK